METRARARAKPIVSIGFRVKLQNRTCLTLLLRNGLKLGESSRLRCTRALKILIRCLISANPSDGKIWIHMAQWEKVTSAIKGGGLPGWAASAMFTGLGTLADKDVAQQQADGDRTISLGMRGNGWGALD